MPSVSSRGAIIVRHCVLGVMYFFIFVTFGAPAWPSALAAVFISIVALLNIERRVISVIGVILFFIAVGVSLSLLPNPLEWKLL